MVTDIIYQRRGNVKEKATKKIRKIRKERGGNLKQNAIYKMDN